MEELLSQTSSLSWWLGVVVVGLLINLAAAYLKPKIDKLSGRFSDHMRQRNRQKQAEWEGSVSKLIQDDRYRSSFEAKIGHQLHQCVFFVVIGIAMLLIGASLSTVPEFSDRTPFTTERFPWAVPVSYLIGTLAVLVGQINHSLVRRMQKKLRQAHNAIGYELR